ncbi:MAG: hypothetical protein H7841_06070 [Magnetospirillum sp. WYHS-4]
MSEFRYLSDAARISVDTPLSPDELKVLASPERLIRINPMLEIQTLEPDGADGLHLVARNLSNGHAIDTAIAVERDGDTVILRYDAGLKARTLLQIEAGPTGGGRLIVTDDYDALPESERAERAPEVDRSLVPWGHALHGYFRLWRRWSWLGPWRWYMDRVWLNMTPSGRRIAYMLWAITAFEIAAALLLAAALMGEPPPTTRA